MNTDSRTDGRQRDLTPAERRLLVRVPDIQRPTRRQLAAAYANGDERARRAMGSEPEFWRLFGGAGVARRNTRADSAEYAVKSASIARGAAVSGTGKPKGDA